MKVERPAGVTAVAIAFFGSSAYLLAVGLTMLARPGLISLAAGAELLSGLELAGPYMFLLAAGLGVAVALRLLCLHRWARWTAILFALIGLALSLPSISAAVIDFRFGKLVQGGLGVMARTMIVWYLFQEPVKEAFEPDAMR